MDMTTKSAMLPTRQRLRSSLPAVRHLKASEPTSHDDMQFRIIVLCPEQSEYKGLCYYLQIRDSGSSVRMINYDIIYYIVLYITEGQSVAPIGLACDTTPMLY